MAAARILLVIVCLTALSGFRLPGGGIVGDEKGYKEIVTGRRGPHNDTRRLIEIARKEIGIREFTENSSPRIDQYLNYVGFRKAPWCACFVSFCFGQAGYKAPKTAWSPALFPKERLARDALPGMVMGIYFPSKGRIAHCGIVESLRGDYIISIEGNTNVAGSREGDAVMRKLRHKRTIAKYADWL
ncbi:peptidoglycan-binding protein [Pedobacter heparinus]|uniref:peptidoglycan-binding protein n=1 Tax=Pedobacter heparinus TaxID=984 RepID=UPI00292EAF55|nr:peptidoglycan-binding protein [Pedobacter heparinus]